MMSDEKWTGSVKDLVDAVGDSDARRGPIVDAKSGAKIWMNLDGSDDPDATEPFYIESPDGDNLYDANNRREAEMILSNIRKGEEYPDLPSTTPRGTLAKKSKSKSRRRSTTQSISLSGMR